MCIALVHNMRAYIQCNLMALKYVYVLCFNRLFGAHFNYRQNKMTVFTLFFGHCGLLTNFISLFILLAGQSND